MFAVLFATTTSPVFRSEAAEPTFVRGVNLAGAEGGKVLPGRVNFDYVWPSEKEIKDYADRGVTVIRLEFRWERLQPQLGGKFDPAYSERLEATIRSITDKGIICLIDLHNYGVFQVGQEKYPIGSPTVTVADFIDVWTRLAELHKANRRVWFGLMNEPTRIPAEQWRDMAQAVVNAIRKTGARNKLLVPGTAFSNASTWVSRGNADAMRSFVDPENNFAFEVHQYLNKTGSGTSGECVKGAGKQRLRPFIDWLKSLPNPAKGFLGEFGGGDSSVPGQENCASELTSLLEEVEQNKELWLGWTVLGGGPWWAPNYHFRLEATAQSPDDTNLMRFYEKYWKVQ